MVTTFRNHLLGCEIWLLSIMISLTSMQHVTDVSDELEHVQYMKCWCSACAGIAIK